MIRQGLTLSRQAIRGTGEGAPTLISNRILCSSPQLTLRRYFVRSIFHQQVAFLSFFALVHSPDVVRWRALIYLKLCGPVPNELAG
jgi:hypothetical protein